MTFIEKLEQTIRWDKSMEEQREVLSQFDAITEYELQEIWKFGRKSTEAGLLIEYLGYERHKGHLTQAVEFLQDPNWPAAGNTARMLCAGDETLVPYVRQAFTEDRFDAVWHRNILSGLVRTWNPKMLQEIYPDLLELIQRADMEGASLVAIRILYQNGFISQAERTEYFSYLQEKYQGNDYLMEDLLDEMNESA